MIGGESFDIWIMMIVLYVINDLIAIWYYKQRQKRKHEKFLRAVKVEYPDAHLTFIAVESSDKEAMADLERRIRENRYENVRQFRR